MRNSGFGPFLVITFCVVVIVTRHGSEIEIDENIPFRANTLIVFDARCDRESECY